jgi:hypothetical protein
MSPVTRSLNTLKTMRLTVFAPVAYSFMLQTSGAVEPTGALLPSR